MNIWMRFEDSYGCATLFQYSNSFLNSEKLNVKIDDGFGNSGVFKIAKRDAERYDYIIVIFDLDDNKNYSLTSESLLDSMSRNILKSDYTIKPYYLNKLILVPIFFCYETLYLFLGQFQNLIKDIYKLEKTEPVKLIELYKSYYDYSRIHPESMYGIVKDLDKIKMEMLHIQNMVKQKENKFYPQHFHREYGKQLMKICFKEVVEKHGDKILVKKEEELFKELQRITKGSFVDTFITDIGNKNINNDNFYKLLTIQNVNGLKNMVLTEEALKNICKRLDDYNSSIKGNKIDICDLLDLDMEANNIYQKVYARQYGRKNHTKI